MNCIQCQNPNPATVQFCQRCGARLNLTADEIRDTLIERESLARVDKTNQNAKQALFFGIVMFIASLTLYIAAGSPPRGAVHLPSAAESATYGEFQYRYEPEMSKARVPYEVNRKP
ncbi:MAG TPA: zinc ribbon domain-containing protein [Planctomycetota bacterium]|nr:zinc ribbon domain-containing protein [Planctomycetota bacterium]